MPDPGGVNPVGGKVRAFFALWPDPATRARLLQATRRLHRLVGGRPTRPDTLHLTLVFLGDVEVGRLPELNLAVARVNCPGFDLAFDQEACWRHNRVAHLGASQPPPGLFDLVDRLSAQLRDAGFAFDTRPYVPHITLIRRADCARFPKPSNENPAPEPIPWSAREFVLVKSSLRPEGARYEPMGRWPLP